MCDVCGDLPCPLDLAESKTSAVERWARENNKPVFYVPAASTEPEDIFGPMPDLFGMKERIFGAGEVRYYLLGPAGTGRGFIARQAYQPPLKPAPKPCDFRPTLHLYMGVGQR